MISSVAESSLTLDQLRAFVAVVDTGTFSAAGRRIGRVQSAVSYAVGTLEDHLGIKLFDRRGYRPVLTPAGAAVLTEARSVLASVHSLATVAAEAGGQAEAEVSLAVDVMFPLDALVAFAARFDARWPQVALRIRSEVLTEVVDLLLRGDCSLGVVNATLPLDGLERGPLTSVRLVTVAASDHALARLDRPLTKADLPPFVQVVLSGRGREASEPDRGVLAEQTWRVLDLGAKHALILAGLGWGSLPEAVVADDLAAGRLRRIVFEGAPASLEAPLVTAWRANPAPGPATRWAIDELAAVCADWPDGG